MPAQRPRVKREDRYEYTDKTTGKRRSFEAAADETVATFAPTDTSEVAASLGARTSAAVDVLSPERGFAILRVSDAGAARTMQDGLAETPEIANALPVMIDGDGARRYFMPDELTVQFAEGVSDEAAQEVLAELGMSVVQKQRTPGYYTAGVAEGGGLFEGISALSARDDVVFAEPSEIGVDDLLAAKGRGRAKGGAAVADDGPPPADPVVIDGPLCSGHGPARLDWDGVGIDRELGASSMIAPELDGAELADELDSDAEALPGDTHFGRLWGLHNVGQNVNGSVGTVDADIDAPAAWNVETGKKHVVVAVIDTGCDLDHPDLASNLLPRGSEDWDFADAVDKEPWDSGTHGTHVAGTVAALRNGSGVVGVAYGSWVMPLRVNLTSGMNQNRADAINYVADQAAAHSATRRYVINCSWKMSGDHAGVRTAIQNAVAKNVVVVFAAGNANNNIDTTPQYPAVYPEVIAVAATDQKDQRAWFSNYGKKVDVAAPGTNIYSTVPNNTYGYKDGTSMAAPHVAGLAALIWSRDPGLTNKQVRTCIEKTCDDIDAKNPGFGGKLGKGRINAYRALQHTGPTRLRTRRLRTIPFPQKNAGSSTGLSFLPSFPVPFFGRRPSLLFLTQKSFSEKLYFIDPWTGAVQRSIDPVANDTIGSLAWDGWSIRVANVTTGAGSINRINAFNGAQFGSIPAPAGRGEGLAVFGSRIFYSTITHVHELSAATGSVLRSFPAPGGSCRGLTYGRGLLFSANSAAGVITVFNPWTLQVRGTIQAPGGGSAQAEGIAFDAKRSILYVANQSENRIYALRVYGI